MRYAIILTLLLFEPIVIDQQTFNLIQQSAHANMRGTEYDMLMQMLNSLEQQAAQQAAQKKLPQTPSQPEQGDK